ncbi:uncharacterized protein LOC110704374 [Chenopodium quinoa]|uniref:uncharacterized protein LOC110704374 n=1 Tax=Chenopodium quinoa TaxID=63459 RepID=UPI000B779B6E|nr:uncharacterized protein LOC110704374 [Chenopodium quinoa]
MWAFSNDGCYSVKTAYMLGKSCNLDLFHKAWIEIWKLEVTPKVRHFLWRVCTGTLPVRAYLMHRHMTNVVSCPWCVDYPETVQHAMFDYHTVRELWVECDCVEMSFWPTGMSFLDLLESWSKLDARKVSRGAILMWYLWNRRNEMVFNGKEIYHPVIVKRTHRLAADCNTYMKKKYGGVKRNSCRSPKGWKAQPEGIVKLNCDASLCDEGWVGMGVIARDWKGDTLFAAARRVRAHWSPIIAEGKAVALAIKLAKRLGLKEVIIESDSQVIINRLTKASIFFTDLDAILDDILSSCSSFSSVVWCHVKRDGNVVAHNLARLTPFGVEQVWENHVPCEVSPYVLMDKLSI